MQLRHRACAAFVALGCAIGLAACSPELAPTGTVLQVTPLPRDPSIHLTDAGEPALTVYLSNQSFADDPVGIQMSIDGVRLVDGRFFVEGQHNWVAAPITLPPGTHTVVASGDNGVSLTETFVIPDGEQRWAVLDYWHYPDEGGPHLSWTFDDEPIWFA